MQKTKTDAVTATPAPEFREPSATLEGVADYPAPITYTVRDPNTGELVSSSAEFKKSEENEK